MTDNYEWRPDADVQVLVPALPSAMATIRMTGKLFCENLGLDSRCSHLVILAVDEACTNVIKHCYEGGPGKIMVSYRDNKDTMEIRVRDWGPHCPEGCLKPKPDQELRPGGFGLVFIHSIMNEVKLVHHPERGNELVMKKILGEK